MLQPKRVFAIRLLFFGLGVSPIHAQQIGIQWEFNQDGDAEGWEAFHSLDDLRVENGVLSAAVTGDFPQLTGPSFSLDARSFGFLEIRLMAEGATDAIVQWKPDSLLWGFQKFAVQGDSAFHTYYVPVFKSDAWRGHILGITRLTLTAKAGAHIAIDYIRIEHLGPHVAIASFKPLRTVLKSGHPIPVETVVGNFGDTAGPVAVDFILPESFSLQNGPLHLDLGTLSVDETDTLQWLVACQTPGDYQIHLRLSSSDSDSVTAVLPARITDRYWRQEKFFLSAWSPPCAWDPPPLQPSHFDYYHQANFDLVLWVVPTIEGVNMTRQFDMQCLLNVGGLVGGDPYLRDPKADVAPDIAPLLPHLDPVIQQFQGDSTVTGYFITDEPHVNTYANLGKVVAYLREKDPTRLSFINLYPGEANQPAHGADTYNEYIEQFLDTVKPEILSYDRYIFFKDHDGGSYFSNLSTIRKWALRYDIPFCNIIQAIGTDCCNLNWRTPTEAEHRWLVYSSLAYGAKGIIWFHWDGSWGVTGSPERDQIAASIKKLNTEIKSIGPEMLKLKSIRVYHTRGTGPSVLPADDPLIRSVSPEADLVLGIFKNKKNQDYLLVMNKDYTRESTTTLTLRVSVDSLRVFDVFENGWKTLPHENTTEGARFEVTLRAGGGKLIALGKAISAGVKSRRPVPVEMNLWPNYPNPFNSGTTIPFQISGKARVSLEIYNLFGQKITALVSKELTSGRYRAIWDGTDDRGNPAASGVYLVRLVCGKEVKSEKILFLK